MSAGRKPPRPFWFRLIRGCLIVYAGLCAFSLTLADKLIFMPQRPTYPEKAPDLVRIGTSNGELIAAYFHPPQPGKPTVLYSHGNAEDISGSLELYGHWRNDGWGVLAYDYPGYGHSTGSPTEASCERAIEASWNHLTDEHGIPPSDIIIVGRSVGSGPSVWLADRRRAAGLVLISPFTSTFAIRPPAHLILPGNRFPNLSRIRRNDTPLLVIHGERDSVIPSAHGHSLHQASPAEPKRFVAVPMAGHNGLGWMDIVAPIEAFADELRRDQN